MSDGSYTSVLKLADPTTPFDLVDLGECECKSFGEEGWRESCGRQLPRGNCLPRVCGGEIKGWG